MEEDLEEIDFHLDGVSEHEHERNEINGFAILLTQFAWLIILLIPVGYGFLFPRMHPAQLFTSKQPSKKWDTKEDPKIFTHSTDIHLSYAEPLKITNTRLLLHSAKFYKADFNLITGDMVDSYGEKNWPKIGHQVKEDWDLWKKLVDEDADNFSILDIPGNHDMWGIIKPLSDQNLFLDYSYTFNRENTKTFKDFVVRKIVQNGIVFILISQYRFPDVHPPYTYWPHPSTVMLD